MFYTIYKINQKTHLGHSTGAATWRGVVRYICGEACDNSIAVVSHHHESPHASRYPPGHTSPGHLGGQGPLHLLPGTQGVNYDQMRLRQRLRLHKASSITISCSKRIVVNIHLNLNKSKNTAIMMNCNKIICLFYNVRRIHNIILLPFSLNSNVTWFSKCLRNSIKFQFLYFTNVKIFN